MIINRIPRLILTGRHALSDQTQVWLLLKHVPKRRQLKPEQPLAERKWDIKIEKARLEAELDALQQEKEAEAAIAKAVVLEAAADELCSRGSLKDLQSLPNLEGVHEKVSEYVAKHI